jgi:hypothetical protein
MLLCLATFMVVVTNHNISIIKNVKIIKLKKVFSRRISLRYCIIYFACGVLDISLFQ